LAVPETKLNLCRRGLPRRQFFCPSLPANTAHAGVRFGRLPDGICALLWQPNENACPLARRERIRGASEERK